MRPTIGADPDSALPPALADQHWFWTKRWQEREREVDGHAAAGRVAVHQSTEEFLGRLDDLDAE